MEPLGLSIGWFPVINAILNIGSAIFLILAFIFIRQRRVQWHRISIILALGCSALFLTSYLFYHSIVGHVPYKGTGWIRILYYGILLSHTLLAIVVLPMIISTIRFALLSNFERHPKIGRITLAIWLYVSLTGVIVFGMLRPYAVEHFKKLQSSNTPIIKTINSTSTMIGTT